jgi:pimeloyl-[acyl-carrier protein] methyl ester esterase
MAKVFFEKKGSGPALLLLHGWAFDASIWNGVARQLQQYYTIVTADLPGHGRTPYMSPERFFEELLPAIGQNFTVLGWSLGGLYATACANLYSKKVSCLINIASSPCFVAQSDWPGIEENILDRFYQRYNAHPDNTIKDFIALQSRPSTNGDSVQMPKVGANLESGLELLKSWDLRKVIMTLDMPVHYLLGKRDSIVPCSLAQSLRNNYPSVQVQLWRNAAHMPFISEPGKFINYIIGVA